MKIYLLETGFCSQSGTILNAYRRLADALDEIMRLQDNEERKTWLTVTFGCNEYDNTKGVITGFWSGPTNGNTHANGWRVREIEVI